MNQPTDSLQARLMVPRIVWASMLASVGVYVFVAATQAPPPPETLASDMFMMLALVAVITAVMSFFLPAFLYRKALSAAMGSGNADGQRPDEGRALALFFTPFILSVALSEAVAIYGLVLALEGWGMQLTAPFFATGALLIAARFPTRERVLGPLRRL